MPKNKFHQFPISDWMQSYVERNIGKPPIWKFPPISEMEEGIYFRPLNFHNQTHFLELFEKDEDPWIEDKFKDAEKLYEYVCMSRIIMPYSFKRGGQDWLVYKEKECVGILHGFDFNKESGEFTQRRCSIGYAFGANVRSTGIPQKVVQHFQNYLFTKWNMLYLTASVKKENIRSIRFLKGLEYIERTSERDWQTDDDHFVSDTIILDLFRSKRTQNKIQSQWTQEKKDYLVWRATWVKQPDGSYKIPKN